MCFNSRSDNRLPPLYYNDTQLSYTDTFKYLGMVCDKQINLTTVADLVFLKTGQRDGQPSSADCIKKNSWDQGHYSFLVRYARVWH